MTMTKKEREEMQALRDELAIAKAWRRTGPVPCDLPAPSGIYAEQTSGWVFNSHSLRAQRAWSGVAIHGIGYATEKEHRASRNCASQRAIPLYSTEELALRAMRYEIEKEAAKALAKIDAMIVEAEVTP